MKQLAKLVLFVIFIGCSEPMVYWQDSELEKHNMKIIPEVPIQSDEIKLVIFDDCTYNTLSGITRSGSTIDIKKQYNGLMKWPCIMKNDTILIGKLPQGAYNVNYTLIDISQQAPQNISVSFTFKLDVGK